MALHFLRHKHRFHLNSSLIRIFSTSSSNVPSQSPFSNFFTEKPLVESRRKSRNSGDVFDLFFTRRQAKETQSRVVNTEQPKEEKLRRVGRPRKQVLEQKPVDETRSRAASLSRTRRKKVTASSSSSRNALKNHPDYICSVTHAMDVLNGLPRLKKWTPLYQASMDHLMADVTHRQAFLSFSDPEDRIQYLRYKTKKTE
ncbi:unnamed protein product [Arabis nemorensis]|uniref:Uncharacterized protein n=1 Tax=Arabis nemorensis TaxID=586526 RepID=A0A565B521_9BRAS|nr:unnamed protein product [Arabis nemorensis]